MAHIRRKFDEASSYDQERSSYGIKEIAKLYAIEKQIMEASPVLTEEEIVKLRLTESMPILSTLNMDDGPVSCSITTKF